MILAVLLSGCSSSDQQAAEAFSNYETQLDAGDLFAARKSLLKAVGERDDVPDYWEALGRLQLQLGDMDDANYAFTRANELDRSNPKVLSALAQISLAGGNLDAAHNYARELALLSPNDPSVLLVNGYLAFRQGELDSADADADKLIAMLPLDTGAKLLKARVLAAQGEQGEAIDLLEKQAAAKPNDADSLKALLLLLKRQDDWPKIAAAAARLARLRPNDDSAALTAIEAAFRANDVPMAMKLSVGLLGPSAKPGQMDSVLQLWARFWPSPAAVQQARELASAAPPQQRLAYASFFNEMGHPREAAELAGGSAQTPVTLANSSRNAIFAQALAISGHAAAARTLLDAVLAKDPDHVYALRSRTELEISSKQFRSAVRDAERLVTIEPNSADDRLLLARSYEAGGDPHGAIECLWNAFHDIPADEQIYQALRLRVLKSDGNAGAAQVDSEFNHQRDVKLAREFI
jgi:predicted Zn-dependent protease